MSQQLVAAHERALLHFTAEIDKHRLHLGHRHRKHRIHKGACLVAVSLDGRDMGLVYLLGRSVDTLPLEDASVALGKVAAGTVGHGLLAQGVQSLQLAYGISPRLSRYESVHKALCTLLVALHGLQLLALHVVEDSLKQRLVPLAAGEPAHLCKHQVTHLLQCLTLLGTADGPECTLVGHAIYKGLTRHDLLCAIEILVKETALAIGEDAVGHLHHQVLGIGLGGQPPAESHHGSLLAHHIYAHRSLERLLTGEGSLGQTVGCLP